MRWRNRFAFARWAVGTIAVVCLASSAAGLDPARRPDSYSIQGWNTEHGLPSGKIRAVTQTRDGYLWIATAQGIARFDGRDFTVFTGTTNPELRGGGFFAVQEAPDGSLWFGGDNGLFRLRGNRFEQFTTAQGLAHNYVRALALTRDGAIVACTRTGYSVMRHGKLSTPDTWKSVEGVARTFLEQPDGSTLLGTGLGLWRVRGEKIERLSGKDGLPATGFYGLDAAPDGSVWMGHNAGVTRWRPDGQSQHYGVAQGLSDPRVQTMRVDRDGNVWIIGLGGGLFRLARGRVQSVVFPSQPSGLKLQQIFEDREGALWLAASIGLFRVRDNMCRTIGPAEGLKQTSVYSVFEASDGAWWIGIWGGGVYRYDQNTATKLAVPPALGLDQVLAFLEEPAGTFWIGANSGLYRHHDGVTANLYRRDKSAAWLKQLESQPAATLPGIAHAHVNSMAPDGEGGLWVATDGALYRGCDGAFRVFTKADGFPGEFFRSVIRTRSGETWVSAAPGGVARLRDGRWTQYLCGRELASLPPRAVYEDSVGAIWVTTEGGGLNRLEGGRWRTFTTRDGLDDDFISGFVEDKRGNFWIAFPRGVMRVPRDEFAHVSTGDEARLHARMFDKSDGLPAAETNQMGSPNTWLARDGRVLVATDGGVAVIEPDNLKSNTLPPPMHLERIMINGAATDATGPISVPPGPNHIQIYYTAVSLLAAERVRFKIQLAPLDTDWVDNGGRREVRYDKLPPGDYTFRVIGCNNDGVWNNDGLALPFTVRPHFYQTYWFSGAMLVIVGGAAFGIYRAQVRRAGQQMAKLETLVEKRTRELRSAKEAAEAAVAAKNEFIDALSRAERDRERLHRQLLDTSRRAGMAEVATGVLHNVGNVLNSVNVSATLIFDRMRHSKSARLGQVADLLRQHESSLGEFLVTDPKGRMLPTYVGELAKQLTLERSETAAEAESLQKNIEHIKNIVAMQQSYARTSGVTETVSVSELVEDALRLNAGALARHGVAVVREYRDQPTITVEKHKVLQILVNVIGNAKYACDESNRSDKTLTVRISADGAGAKIEVSDNGIGIRPENLTRIFAHGFTTRRHGHGFGLHSGALAARELGGRLTASSDGPGHGACFTLALPQQPPPAARAYHAE